MMIHLAMNDLPAWRDEALRGFAYVHLAPDMAMMARTYTEAIDGLLPAEPILVVGQPTIVDPARAPAGKHVLWIQVRTLPYRIRGDAAGTIDARDWASAKELFADRVIDILERYAPGTKAHVLARNVASPLDLEADVPNLVEGDSLSGSHHLDQNFLFRPAFTRARYRTGIAGLHMIGASTWPGAGTGAGSGFLCAQQLAGA
jgi:phytoene dehydrogenase-like protein